MRSIATAGGRCAVAATGLMALALGACGGGDGESNPFGLRSEVVTNADRAIAMAFAPDGRLFYAEHLTGQIRVVTHDGKLLNEPFAKLAVATYGGLDWGLTGLALDPDFDTNHYVYAFFTQMVEPEPITGTPVIVRFTDKDNVGVDQQPILDGFPTTIPGRPGFKTNGGLNFGPDGFLYASVGDYDQYKNILGPGGEWFAQDLTIPAGKLLRINKTDGEAPGDNPLVGQEGMEQRIFAYGFSKQFDFAFHPETDAVYGTDTTGSCEELNVIERGADYGWPDVGDFPWPECNVGDNIKAISYFTKEGATPGAFLSGPGVQGMAFLTGGKYPVLGTGLLACESETRLLRRLVLTPPDYRQVTSSDVAVRDCKLDVAISPDGTVYYSNETEIRRLVQGNTETPDAD